LACAARLAFLQLDRALNGDRHDPEEMELAQFALRDLMNKAERLNAKHGTGPACQPAGRLNAARRFESAGFLLTKGRGTSGCALDPRLDPSTEYRALRGGTRDY